MKKVSVIALFCAAVCVANADAARYSPRFGGEVADGIDITVVHETFNETPIAAPGELGRDVYETYSTKTNNNLGIYIPTTMYMRMGGGVNIGAATKKAELGDDSHSAQHSYIAQIGLGWHLSSYVRADVDFQALSLGFSGLSAHARYRTLGGNLYFDLRRRYVMTGDVTTRRDFVPFIGFGAAVGQYRFDAADGVAGPDGMLIAPRAMIGFNIAFTDLVGLDLMYQHSLVISDGFGWNGGKSAGMGNVMASLRFNF